MKVFEDDKMCVYLCSDNRYRAYIKSDKRVVSYPRILMEEILGRPLEENEQVHHKNHNTTNNDYENLSVELLGEHQRMHSKKYFDTIVTCCNCGKEFLWTAKQQKYFYSNQNRLNRNVISNTPFCSKHCAGSFSRKEQLRRNT